MESNRLTRRTFLSSVSTGVALAPAIFSVRGTPKFPQTLDRVAPVPPATDGAPSAVARNESYWGAIQQAFTLDRSLIHLNNGGVIPSPLVVQEALMARQREAYSKPFYVHLRALRPQLELLRRRLADAFGAEGEEIAFTRNTSEGMEICQLGCRLAPGDEILTTDQDYPRMINTWKQRGTRGRIRLRQLELPVPWTDDDDIVNQFEAHLTPRTRLIMICHLIDLTGQVLPVKRIAALAHAHGIPLMVDGAQGFGQLHFTQADLDCDFYATSLHKWLMGPHGTGMLFIRKDRISSIWPLMPADVSLADDIRKFEDTGTQSPAGLLALSDALVFHQSIGAARKEARLRFLRDYWLRELDGFDRLSVLTNCEPACSAGMATVSVEGIDSRALRDYLWGQHRITVRAIDHPNVKGIRISPGIYTTLEELDYFVGVMHGVLKSGLS